MYKIFISYSRIDSILVRPIVDLMRTTGVSIFKDEDCIPPGKRWRPIITKNIKEIEVLILFWCIHAKKSKEVLKEWKQALNLDKDIIPVILDETPLPLALREYNGIDFRVFFSSHSFEGELLTETYLNKENQIIDTEFKIDHLNHHEKEKFIMEENKLMVEIILRRIKTLHSYMFIV